LVRVEITSDEEDRPWNENKALVTALQHNLEGIPISITEKRATGLVNEPSSETQTSSFVTQF